MSLAVRKPTRGVINTASTQTVKATMSAVLELSKKVEITVPIAKKYTYVEQRN